MTTTLREAVRGELRKAGCTPATVDLLMRMATDERLVEVAAPSVALDLVHAFKRATAAVTGDAR